MKRQNGVKDCVSRISEGRRKTFIDAGEDSPHEDYDDDDDDDAGKKNEHLDLNLFLKASKLSAWKRM